MQNVKRWIERLKMVMTTMHRRSIRTPLCSVMQLMLHSPKWLKMHKVIQAKRFHQTLMSLLDRNSTKISLRPCLITTGNFSVLKINNKFWSKKPNKEVYQFHRFFHQRKRSCRRRPRRWLTSTAGSSLSILALVHTIIKRTRSCNSKVKFCQTKKPTDISMKQ